MEESIDSEYSQLFFKHSLYNHPFDHFQIVGVAF